MQYRMRNEANPSHDGTPNYNIQSKTISIKGTIRIYLLLYFFHSTQTNRYIQNKKGRGSVFQDCICEGVIAILGFPCLKAFEIVLLLVFRCLHMVPQTSFMTKLFCWLKLYLQSKVLGPTGKKEMIHRIRRKEGTAIQ